MNAHAHTHTRARTQTHPQKTQIDKLVKLVRQAEYALPAGMIKAKLRCTVISLCISGYYVRKRKTLFKN